MHSGKVQKKADLVNQYYNDTIHGPLTKFMVVRHPFDRLISAYYQKIAIDVDAWFRPFRNILKSFYHKSNSSQPQQSYAALSKTKTSSRTKYESVTFSEFVNYVIDDYYDKFHSGMIRKGHKEHYVSYFPLCDPCHIHYDMILRTETNNQDAHNILDIIHLQEDFMDGLAFNRAPQRGTVSGLQKTLPEFEALSDNQIKELLKIYKHDLNLFGYGFDVESKTAYCQYDDDHCC